MPKLCVKYSIFKQGNKKGGTWYHPATKTKSLFLVSRELRESGPIYIKVTYLPGVYNHGTFDTITKAKQFIHECTEKDLLKYAENWE
jgi:hypothetical protein